MRVGLDDVRGYLAGGMQAWVEAGHDLAEALEAAEAMLAASQQPVEIAGNRFVEPAWGAFLRKAGYDARYMAGGHYAWKAVGGKVRRLEE